MDSRYMRNSQIPAPGYSGPRRARPVWLAGDPPKPPASQPSQRDVGFSHSSFSGVPSQYLKAAVEPPLPWAPSAVRSCWPRSTPSPPPRDMALAQTSNGLCVPAVELSLPPPAPPVPLIPEPVCPAQKEYLLKHRLTTSDISELTSIVDRVASNFPPDQIKLVGAFADGTASRCHTKCITLACTGDVSRLSGKREGDSVAILTMHPYTVRVDTNPVLIKRTVFVKMYTHIVEPRMGVAVVLLMSRLHAKFFSTPFWISLDYYVFVLLFKALVARRVIPDLVSADTNDGRMQSDKRFWNDKNSDSATIRTKWRKEGICVSSRMSVFEIMTEFIQFVRDWKSMHAVCCPIDGKNISGLFASEFFQFVASLEFS